MGYSLLFNPENYRVESVEAEGHTVVYRAYEDLVYVERPVAEEYQRMNIYVPELLMEGGTIGRYDRHTAPVFLANTVGGYLWEPGAEGLRGLTEAISAVPRPASWISRRLCDT